MTKKNTLILIGVTTALTVTTFVLVTRIKKKRKFLQLQKQEVADEGYETAFDILFPLQSPQWRKNKVKYM
jgi:hypothetical protein